MYLNIVADLNGNGSFDATAEPGLQEWSVQNLPVAAPVGDRLQVQTFPFRLSTVDATTHQHNLGDGIRMRVLVTQEALAPGSPFDETGMPGELVVDIDLDETTLADARAEIVAMDCPARVDFDGADEVEFSCEWHGLTPALTTVRYALSEVAGGTTLDGELDHQGELTLDAEDHGAMTFLATVGELLPSHWRYWAMASGYDPIA